MSEEKWRQIQRESKIMVKAMSALKAVSKMDQKEGLITGVTDDRILNSATIGSSTTSNTTFWFILDTAFEADIEGCCFSHSSSY